MALPHVLKIHAAALAIVACAAFAQPIEPTARPGCTAAILTPAKRDYAAAAAKANIPSPQPFPEAEFLESVEPMCACIARRVAETKPLDAIQREGTGFAQPFIEEALSGGRCRPQGLLGRMLFDRKK